MTEQDRWRAEYTACIEAFKNSEKTAADEIQLIIKLRRLGFSSANLNNEVKYLKENA